MWVRTAFRLLQLNIVLGALVTANDTQRSWNRTIHLQFQIHIQKRYFTWSAHQIITHTHTHTKCCPLCFLSISFFVWHECFYSFCSSSVWCHKSKIKLIDTYCAAKRCRKWSHFKSTLWKKIKISPTKTHWFLQKRAKATTEVLYWIWSASAAMAKRSRMKTQRKLMTMKTAAIRSTSRKEVFSMSTMIELPMIRKLTATMHWKCKWKLIKSRKKIKTKFSTETQMWPS